MFLVSLMLSGCSDQGVTAYNAPPEAVITSHQDGDAVVFGVTTGFRGAVSDPDHESGELQISWYAGQRLVCGPEGAQLDGLTACDLAFEDGETDVTLEVQDPGDAGASDKVTLEILPPEAPTAAILGPVEGEVYYSDQLIAFEGLVADAEDAPQDLLAWWTDSDGATLTVDAIPDGVGIVLGYGNLPEGQHALSLWVQDTSERTGRDTVLIEVGPPNSAPTCELTAPQDGSGGEEGALVTFGAWADDVDVGADSLSATFSSDKDGELGEVTPGSDGTVAFAWSGLSVATHTIALTVADELGATCTDLLLYTVGSPPSVTISAPGDGDVFEEDATVILEALAADDDDSLTSLDVSWTSSLDGAVGGGAPDSAGAARVTTDGLSVGVHAVSVTATDPLGLTGTDTITLEITGCTAVWYRDADTDGYGDPDTTTTACDAPSGYTADSSDCDDGDAAISPAGSETCNGVDDDCDTLVDDDDPSNSGSGTWYADSDGDGHGDPLLSTVSCSAPSGTVSNDDDCDDGDAGVHPGAAETCDGVDEDCDGTIDESATDASTWYADTDGDGYGDPGVSVDDCSAPSGYIADDTDCDDTDAAIHPGATELCNGLDDDCDGTVPSDEVDSDGDGALDCEPPTCVSTGVTWQHSDEDTGAGIVEVGCVSCDPYVGDTDCNESRGIVCLYPAGYADPGTPTSGYYHGWTGGDVAISAPTTGCSLGSNVDGDAVCAAEFGTGWVMGEWHDGGGGWAWWGYEAQEVDHSDSFWIYIDDQSANCWN